MLLLATCGWQSAWAQTDCLTGFNCGRVAYIEDRFQEATGYRLWSMNPDGSRRSMLLEFGPSNHNLANGLVFGRDSRKLFFTASAASSFDASIFSANADGSGLTNLTNDSCFNSGPLGYQHSLSPDGGQIVFVRNCGSFSTDSKIWVMNVDGTGQRLLTTSPLVNSDPTGDEHRSPQFSPNGSRIVFTSRAASSGSQQVYLSSLDGSSVMALTTREEFGVYNDSPRFMPDGRIVFASRRDRDPFGEIEDLYRIDGDGSNFLRLTNMVGRKFGYAISPDNSRMLFGNDVTPDVFTDGSELYVVRTNGTDLITLSNDPTRYAGRARFSADGSQIGFELRRFSPNDGPTTTRFVNLDGSNPVDYTDPTQDIRFDAFGRPDVDDDGIIDGADSCPAVPNGYRIAMSSNRVSNYEIWTTDFNGGSARRLTNSSASDAAPRFDATGNRIVFHSNRLNNRNEIYVMNADGSSQLPLTNIAGNNITPAYSHDASKITFLSSRDGAQRNVWIMDADGSNQIKLTTNQGFINTANNPVFNHNGTRIAFDSDRGQIGNANHDIFTMSPTGTDELRLTTAIGRDSDPSYSADGSRIAFVSFRDGGLTSGEIYTMNADGSGQRRVTQSNFAETEPVFTADGAQIVFRADYDGESEIYVINRDGSRLRRVTDAAGFTTDPSAAPQPDRDGDGVGDACDNAVDVPTGTGTDVTVNAPDAQVTFSAVATAGSTAFVAINPTQGQMPLGYTLCATCPAYDITTTASYTPPVSVCLAVPASVAAADFLNLRLLHGENGSYVDRTAFRVDEPGSPRWVCGTVQSLSPFALATFARATTSSLMVSPIPSRLGQPTTFTGVVNGIDAAPAGGRVIVGLDSTETCSSETPLSTVGPLLTFSCEIAFASYGPRTAIAQFVDSSTHANSETATADVAVMRVVDVTLAALNILGGVSPGEATQYRVELRNLGPDAAPAVTVSAVSDPPLLGQTWTCVAQGGAVCPTVGGSGEVNLVVDLPAASGLNIVIAGSLPQTLPAQVTLTAEALTDGLDPYFVFDTDLDNNTAVAFATGVVIFSDGFEAD